MPKKLLFVIILILIAAIFFFHSNYAKGMSVGFDPYVFINDTSQKIEGEIIGETSPGYTIDLEIGQAKIVNMSWMTPQVLQSKTNLNIKSNLNLWVIKIVWISNLPVSQ